MNRCEQSRESLGLETDKVKKESLYKDIGFLLFYIAIVIEVMIVIVDKSAFINPIEGRLFQVTFLLCAIKIAMTKYNLKEWLIMLFFLVIGIIVDQITEQNEVIRFVAFVAAAKDVDPKKTLKIVLWLTVAGVLSLAALSLLGVMGDVYLEVDFSREAGVERRYCLGLGHPNALHCMIWALITLCICVYFDTLKVYHYVLLVLLNIGAFVLTDSRTGMLSTMLSIMMGLLCCIFKKLRACNLIYIIGIAAIVASVLFSIYVACYNGIPVDVYEGLPPLLEKINQVTTGRILDGGNVGFITKWRLFSDSRDKGYLDMGYIKLFYWYGIIPGLLYITALVRLVWWSMKKQDIAKLILIVSFSIYTIMEAHVISPYFARNYQLMLLFGVWSEVFLVQNGTDGFFWQFKTLIGKKNVQKKRK